MYLACKIGSFTVKAENEKEAYLKGCKKAARFAASKKYKLTSIKIERINGEENIFQFILFTNIDLGPELSNFCKLCKEYHCSFYVNEEYNCARCNLKNFLSRVGQKARVSKNYYKEELSK